MTRIFWILAMPLLVAAQVASVDVSTPILGYVLDPVSQTLRAIEGVPGAAVLGDRITLEATFGKIAIAPNRRYALAVVPDEGVMSIVRLDDGVGVTRPLDIPNGEVYFSPGGDAIGVSQQDTVEIWTGLPDQPLRIASYPMARGPHLAISDDGGVLVTLANGVLSRIDSEGSKEIGSGFSSMTFLSGSQNLLAVRGDSLITIAKASPTGDELVVGEGFTNTREIALSRDQRVVVCWDGESTITLVDRELKSTTRLMVNDGVIQGLWPAQGNAVFQITQDASRDLWLIDADGDAPRIVPVSKKEAQ